jgi:hypothetical protein
VDGDLAHLGSRDQRELMAVNDGHADDRCGTLASPAPTLVDELSPASVDTGVGEKNMAASISIGASDDKYSTDNELHCRRPGTMRSRENTPTGDPLLQDHLDEVCLLIDHLVGRADRRIANLQLDDPAAPTGKVNLIDAVCRIRWPTTEVDKDSAKQAAFLLKARDQLSELAAPATSLTIAYTRLIAPGSHGKCPLAEQAYPELARYAKPYNRSFWALIALMIVILAVAILLSCYVAYGKLVFQRIEQLDKQRAEIATVLDTIEAAGLASLHPSHGTPSEAWLQNEDRLVFRCRKLLGNQTNPPKAAQLHRACDAAEQLKSKRIAVDRELEQWAYYVPAGLQAWIQESRKPANSSETIAELEEQGAAKLLAILGNYILPMAYGFLGASAAVMLNVNQKIRQSLLKPRDCRMIRVQLLLGIITGACIGLFLTPSDTSSTGAPLSGGSVALSASALSFLAGFGVEGVFKMLESTLITVFGGRRDTTPAQFRP